MSLLSRAATIYRTQGLLELFFSTLNYCLAVLSNIRFVDRFCYRHSIKRLRSRKSVEQDISDVVETTFTFRGLGPYRSISPLQIRTEFEELAALVSDSEPETVMEIGTANGGTLYVWSRVFDSASKIVSVDLPGGAFGGGYSSPKVKFFKEFSDQCDISCIRADSHSPETVKQVREALDGDSIDFLFIDGDHTYDGVKQDYNLYKQFMSEDGIIAFHDIVFHPNNPDCEVDEFWEEITNQEDTTEIISSADQDWAGIGVIYCWSD